ncbi:MAG: class I SAM-dependent methyltransferase [Planctomycetes bacterium]|nr:class I SAM-dependent methyltransferase [Planctomycetota bacterium]
MTAEPLAPLFADLGVDPAHASRFERWPFAEAREVAWARYGPFEVECDIEATAARIVEHGSSALARDGLVTLELPLERSREELARWRNSLWPWVHVVALYRCSGGSLKRETLQGAQPLSASGVPEGTVLVARRREFVLSPQVTVSKFDSNSGGWNGEPGKPGYAHFRWMRKYVGLFEPPREGASILDFGCGAGWVGIEAALSAGRARLAAFDPSPEMVKLAEHNARASGLTQFRGRTGFGEAPPFDERFEHVLSSGVVSFSPDHRAWFDGLARTLLSGGMLVIGDLNRASRGMAQRRARRALLPARELNALTADEARQALESRGFRHLRTAGYQRTRPIPQLAHWSDQRLGGLLSPLLLAYNKSCAGRNSDLGAFDSWVMSFRAP